MALMDRPRTLDEIIGQPRLVAEMRNRSKDLNYASGMIMEGESGSGKTTLGLIVAATLNCHAPAENRNGGLDPCGQCPSCVDIKNERFGRDVHFLDGSTMGKDRVVELEQIANSVPFHDKNKVIIIDEAQELSKQSFGVTLRMLEKKRPAHTNTYFILCTMDRNAIAKPIKDRCQTYKFWPVVADTIANYLFNVVEDLPTVDAEQLPEEFFSEGLFMLADYAAGSVRAALAALERCIYGELWTVEQIQEELGYISPQAVTHMTELLLSGDKTFFEKLTRTQDAINSFYYKSWSALLNAKLYKSGAISEETLPQWKRKTALRYMTYPATVDKVLALYAHLFESARYMKPDYFITLLWTELFEIPRLRENPANTPRKVRKRKEN